MWNRSGPKSARLLLAPFSALQYVRRHDGHKDSSQTAFSEPQSLSARRPGDWPTRREVIQQELLIELAGGTPLKGSHLDRRRCVSLMFFLRVSRGRGRLLKLYVPFRLVQSGLFIAKTE
jgi:hypothetical protein